MNIGDRFHAFARAFLRAYGPDGTEGAIELADRERVHVPVSDPHRGARRVAFEDWARGQGMDCRRDGLMYNSDATRYAWRVWYTATCQALEQREVS